MVSRRRRRTQGTPPDRYKDGKKVCCWCGGSLTGRRTRWCSDKCVEDYQVRSNPSYARFAVEKRDLGVCAWCGLDCHAIEKVSRSLSSRGILSRPSLFASMGLTGSRKSCWDADHIVPVECGGGECGLSNYQTLCWWCHAIKTAFQRDGGVKTAEEWRQWNDKQKRNRRSL